MPALRTVAAAATALLLGLPQAGAFSGAEGRALVRGQLAELLGAGATIRDFAPFETERGEGAFLVLYVTDADTPPDDATLPADPTCPQMVEGVALTGRYHVALVVRGTLVNTVAVPDGPLALPVRHLPEWNARYWADDGPAASNGLAPTRLVLLADFNQDGHADEFRLLRYDGPCGHVDTLLVGYSRRRRQVVIYTVLGRDGGTEWADNFFPHPAQAAARRRRLVGGCDHGGEVETTVKYAYDARQEAWRLFRRRARPCPR